MYKDALEDTKEYFNMRYNCKDDKFALSKILIVNLFHISDYSLRYVILDPHLVTEYGFWGALYNILDSQVSKLFKQLMLIYTLLRNS